VSNIGDNPFYIKPKIKKSKILKIQRLLNITACRERSRTTPAPSSESVAIYWPAAVGVYYFVNFLL